MIEKYLSPYIETIHPVYKKPEYCRYGLDQKIGGICHSKIWFDYFNASTYKISYCYGRYWHEDKIEEAKKHLDDYLINQGYILCSSMKQFEKLKILI